MDLHGHFGTGPLQDEAPPCCPQERDESAGLRAQLAAMTLERDSLQRENNAAVAAGGGAR